MGSLSNKREQPAIMDDDRYEGKPLLILLENYVLDCIGCLSNDKATKIVGVVQRVFGGSDDWKATLRSSLQLDESIDENLRQMWVRNQDLAKQTDKTYSP